MPAPFSPVPIPFISGARQDIGSRAQDNPSQLSKAQNVVFTKRGQITGRPGLTARDAQVQLGPGIALGGSLLSVTAGATPSGIVATGYSSGSRANVDTPLVCWQGQSYFNRAGLWEAAGVHWSLRQTKSSALETHDPSGTSAALRGSQIPVGQDVVGVTSSIGGAAGVPFLNATGDVKFVGTAQVNSPSTFNTLGTDKDLTAVAGNAVFWHSTSLSQVRGFIPTGAGPTTTEITVASTVPSGGLAACTDGTNYYVAYPVAPSPGTVSIVKVGPTGTILQTLNVTFAAGTIAGPLDICYDVTSNRLGLVGVNSAVFAVATKIVTLVSGTMADAGIDLTLAGTTVSVSEAVCCGVTHNGRMSVLFSIAPTDWTTGSAAALSSGTVHITGRLFTAATETTSITLNGAVNSFGFGSVWDPLFAGQTVGGRTLVGVMHGYENKNRSNQWLVMDVTSLYAANNTSDRIVVACGPQNGAERSVPSSVFSNSSSVSFGISEGILFANVPDTVSSTGTGNAPLVRRAATRRITLEAQGVQAVHVHDVTLLSGQLLHVFDGNKIKPHHFPDETPYIFNGGVGFSYTSAGGALAAGSYSYQATWETVNARGQTSRSGASNILVVNGVTLNQQVTVRISQPQMWTNTTAGDRVRIRLWATQTNPTNNALKYLAAETVLTTPFGGFLVTLIHSTVAVGTEETLYETTDTLSDMRAPGADRGVAVSNERAWCADQDKLYASKILRQGIAVSWNTEGPSVVPIPSSLGTIQGLASIGRGLVVLCSRGAALVTGPGVDDTGVGPGWTTEIVDGIPGMGNGGPRSITATPSGVAFQAQDGDVWMISETGQAIPMSRSLRDNSAPNLTTPPDVVVVASTQTTNNMLVAHGTGSALRVLDLEHGQWGTWLFPVITPVNGLFIAPINGALWIQASSPGAVFSVDNAASDTDAGLGAFTAVIETGTLRPANPVPHGWGRLRSLVLNEVRNVNSSQAVINMTVLADQNDKVLMNKTLTTSPTDAGVFPNSGDGTLEFRTTFQRCAYFRVIMSVTPAQFDIEGLDAWVANTGEKSPTNNRG